MKKILSLILLIFAVAVFTFCCTQQNVKSTGAQDSTNNSENNSKNNSTNDGNNDQANTGGQESIPEPDWSKAVEGKVSGMIGVGANDMLVIVDKWGSRSRTPYYVFGDDSVKSKLKENIGKIATVKGLLPKREDWLGMWKRRIYVNEIVDISEKPAE